MIDSLSPHHNVVVGRNGSGKSNFFAAIRFVLSDAYTHMSREERQSLIHEGSGTVMSAYVEVVFANEDRRFPVDRDEVVIRRTIGLKKDDYSLDQKNATRTDIMNLLESAGFSRSNPYYIVPQGRITGLTNAKDSERLELLKEVAGAKVFEVKLKESLKEMANSSKRQEKIDEMLTFIESRIEDLNLEKDDLKHFEKLNNGKKSLEYNVFDRELAHLNDQIEDLDVTHENSMDQYNKLISEHDEKEESVIKLDQLIKELESNVKLLEVEKAQNDDECKQVFALVESLKAQIKDIDSSSSVNVEQDRSTLAELQSAANVKQKQLEKLEPKKLQLFQTEQALRKTLNDVRAKQRLILSKQGRFEKFSSKNERDDWLKAEIAHIEDSIQRKTLSLQQSTQQHSKVVKEMEIADSTREKFASSINEANSQIDILSPQLVSARSNHVSLNDERKTLWKEDAKLRALCTTYDTQWSEAQRSMADTMDRSTASGLDSVRRLTSQMNLLGVYGTLGELIEVSEKYKTAAEVVAGNSLFHVVVDSDATASVLMDHLTREKAGRVTFMPLNRLRPQQIEYPATSDCVPLIKKIACDSALENAVSHVFARTVVCVSLQRGSEIARQHKLNAITLDGDKCDKRGVLSGGFRDVGSKSRLSALKNVKRASAESANAKDRVGQLGDEISAKDGLVAEVSTKISRLQKEINQWESQIAQTSSEVEKLSMQKTQLESSLKLEEQKMSSLQNGLTLLNSEKSELSKELASDFTQSLSAEDSQALREIVQQLPQLEGDYARAADELTAVEVETSRLGSELKDNLLPRIEVLAKAVRSSDKDRESESGELKSLKCMLDNHTQSMYAHRERLDEVEGELGLARREISQNASQLAKCRDQQKVLHRKLENYWKNVEKTLGKKSLLTARRDDVNKKIRELGVLPEEAFSRYKTTASSKLIEKLTSTNESLKKYSHVNKKALEQHVNFTKQRDQLVERRGELTVAKTSIENLINVLEQRKDDAIIRTFHQVSRGFSEIFEKLVPQGGGKLIIEKKNPQDDQAVENYIGVSISVSFNSKHDEQQRIEQLSGGQKSLCAIALILAIQKCDPAPFYLFDEIDANLDTQYRSSVAKLINELSEKDAQFICTTFRPEMLQVADKFYGIMFANKVSTVSDIGRDDALGFIEGQAR